MHLTRLLIGTLLFLSPLAGADVSALYEKVSQSVVVIHTLESLQVIDERNTVRDVTQEALGTGVIIDSEGKILTAAHVVNQSDAVIVSTLNGENFPADVLSSDPRADIALIKIRDPGSRKFSFVRIGDSSKAKIGHDVFVIGTPYGLDHTLTTGILSSRRYYDLPDRPKALEFLQTDAAVNQGNSGGPLFNMKGEVIGIVSHIASQSGGSEGLGFAASSNMIKGMLLESNHLWVGVEYRFIDHTLANLLNVPQTSGLLIENVAKGSLAARMGIRGGYMDALLNEEEIKLGGDIVLEVGGIAITGGEALYSTLRQYTATLKSGDTVTAKVLRNGRIETLSGTVP